MRSFTVFALSLLGKTAVGTLMDDINSAAPVSPAVTSVPLALRAPAPFLKCNADNCLNVMTKTPTVASPFCSKFLQPTTITTITPTVTISDGSTISPPPPPSLPAQSVPSHISQQCALTTSPPLASRLSSACSCLSVSPSSSTVTSTVYAAPQTTTINTPPPICDGLSEGTPYVAQNGKSFNIECPMMYYYDPESPPPRYYNIPGFEWCLETCSQNTQCIAANYANGPSNGGESECTLIYSTSRGYYLGWSAGVLVEGSGS